MAKDDPNSELLLTEWPFRVLTGGAQPWLHMRITWEALKHAESRAMLQTNWAEPLEEGPRYDGFWGSPSDPHMQLWCNHWCMTVVLYHQGYLGVFSKLTWILGNWNLELSGWEVHSVKGTEFATTCCFLSVSKCALCDCFEELGENNSPHLNKAVFLVGQTRSVIMLCFQTKKKVGPWDENERGSLVITNLFRQVPRHLWITVSGWTNIGLSETWLPYKTQGFCKAVIMGQ